MATTYGKTFPNHEWMFALAEALRVVNEEVERQSNSLLVTSNPDEPNELIDAQCSLLMAIQREADATNKIQEPAKW